MTLIRRFFVEDEGADATEYALVIGLVALGIVVGAGTLGGSISTALSNIGTSITNHVPAS